MRHDATKSTCGESLPQLDLSLRTSALRDRLDGRVWCSENPSERSRGTWDFGTGPFAFLRVPKTGVSGTDGQFVGTRRFSSSNQLSTTNSCPVGTTA
jgi:hypothetical protein